MLSFKFLDLNLEVFSSFIVLLACQLLLLSFRLVNRKLQLFSLIIKCKYSVYINIHVSLLTNKLVSSYIIANFFDINHGTYLKKIKNAGLIRQIGISANDVVKESKTERSLFEEENAKEKTVLKTLNKIKEKYGKNSILRAIDLLPEATGRDRNKKIGGHKSGE